MLAKERQHHAFRQQLPDDPTAPRPERRPEPNLPAARRGARQQQVGDVRAGDAQEKRGEQREYSGRDVEHGSVLRERSREPFRDHQQRRPLVGRRILPSEHTYFGGQRRLRSLDSSVGPQTADDEELMAIPVLEPVQPDRFVPKLNRR